MELDDETAEVHRLMAEHADVVLAVVDGSKVGETAPAAVLPADAVTTLVTDASAPQVESDALRERGVNVVVARPQGGS